MPSWYEQPATFALAETEDKDKFAKLPFYLVKNEVKTAPRWNIWDQLFGTIPWKANMGNIMKSARPEPSPIANTFVYPNNVDVEPTKNVYEVDEALQTARIKAQDFETRLITFVPSFQDFWQGQVKYKSSDITRQIQIFNNQFIRTVAYQRSPLVQIAGVADLTNAPYSDEGQTDVKNAAWRANIAAQVKTNLTLNVINRAQIALEEDLDAPPFEGVNNMPSDNEGLKGKFVLLCDSEAYSMFRYDQTAHDLKSVNLDLLFNGFRGSLWSKITCKLEKGAIRFGADGTIYNPQIVLDETAEGRGRQVIVNPDYASLTKAPFGVAWLMGADAYKSIAVGAPPKEFSSKAIDQKKFYSMNWNGEVYITDQVLRVTTSGGNVTHVDTNKYGRLLQLIASVTCGCLPGQPRNCIPIIYRRARPEI